VNARMALPTCERKGAFHEGIGGRVTFWIGYRLVEVVGERVHFILFEKGNVPDITRNN